MTAVRVALERRARFARRVLRNALALTPARRWLWPGQSLATAFGSAETDYGLGLFLSHAERARRHRPGFKPQAALEIGPGRNAYTALLWRALGGEAASLTLWDAYPNMQLTPEDWPRLASDLLAAIDRRPSPPESLLGGVIDELWKIESGARADIRYLVGSQRDLSGTRAAFDYVYSQSALEHVWDIDRLWARLFTLTAPGGLHTHQIDLADHGRRESNFLEMCEWSETEWWLSQRFTPGAVNRRRLPDHLRIARGAGFEVLEVEPTRRPALPAPRQRLSRRFRQMSDDDLLVAGVRLTLIRPD